MKRIGILSDTHGTWDAKIANYLSQCDEIWHAGDIGDRSVLEHMRALGKPLRAVYGNIDGAEIRRECPLETTFTVEGCTVYMRHIIGRPGNYKAGIPARLRTYKPTITVAGHSHILMVKYDADFQTHHINPGAAGTYGQQTVRTLILLTLDAGKPKELEVVELHAHPQAR